MKLQPRIYEHLGKFYFDVVDEEDVSGGLPELVHSDGRPFAREQTAVRNARKWIDQKMNLTASC